MTTQTVLSPETAPSTPPVESKASQQAASTVARRAATLSKTMTFRIAVAMVAAYLAAKLFEAPAEVAQAIVVVGLAAIAISMRHALVLLQREVQRLRGLAAHARPGDSGPPPPEPRHTSRPMYRSMTVLWSLLTVASFFIARHFGAPDGVTNAIVLAGAATIAIYLRRAMVEIWDED
jgi:hypothetical protein